MILTFQIPQFGFDVISWGWSAKDCISHLENMGMQRRFNKGGLLIRTLAFLFLESLLRFSSLPLLLCSQASMRWVLFIISSPTPGHEAVKQVCTETMGKMSVSSWRRFSLGLSSQYWEATIGDQCYLTFLICRKEPSRVGLQLLK